MNSKTPITTSSAFDYIGWREQFIITVLRIACVLGAALIATSFPTASATDRVLFPSLYLILLAITVLKTPYSVRAASLLFMVYIIGTNSLLSWGPWLDGSIFFIAFTILAALLFDNRIDLIALILSALTFVTLGVLQQLGIYEPSAKGVPPTIATDWAAYTVDFSIVSAIILVATNQFKKALTQVIFEMQSAFNSLTTEREKLEDRVRERTEELEARAIQLRAATSVTRTIAGIQDISELLSETTRLITDEFGYYHSGLYLLDERKRTAFLQASSSATGKSLIGQGFRIEPNKLNMTNLVIEQRRPQIAMDVGDANFIRDPNFPLTRSRIMLPLTVRGQVIGILDIHSDQPRTFDGQDAEVLQTLADLVAISIDNVRLIDETKSLVYELESNTTLQTRETWSKFTSRHKPAYQYTPAGVRPLFSKIKTEKADGLHVPMILHGQNIGNIVLKRKGISSTWSERERILVEKVAAQVALALENSRLVDETQKNAMRNQVIANISSRVRETLDVESVVRTATTELRRVFDLKEAEISIGAPQPEPTQLRKNTSSLRLK
ncbi:MAG TPA: GAF domain-containing protein [Anaerolineales bacterium]|nr:GAF domain-containing protein [Anaerolineales bacterium]HMV96180.1 GAF domain-containing protein [Anaerolineales bacterium]HMX19379.1 GAF domain-containing protein [Anaerolineales bacterium]HMX73580.1 GAF domain-containing protein [Anaerolineales bacterium]HMZ43153.1 GAF domain-containing protein [Anaerolineales bacterium]